MGGAANREKVARALAISGVATIVVGVVLAVAIEPYLGAIALIGVADLGLAWAFSSGLLGGGSGAEARSGDRSADPAETEPAAADPTADPSYNPYARED